MAFFGLFGKDKKESLDKGLEKSKESVLGKIGRAIAGSVLLLLLQNAVISGFLQVMNRVLTTLNDAYAGNVTLYQTADSTGSILVFLLFLFFLESNGATGEVLESLFLKFKLEFPADYPCSYHWIY